MQFNYNNGTGNVPPSTQAAFAALTKPNDIAIKKAATTNTSAPQPPNTTKSNYPELNPAHFTLGNISNKVKLSTTPKLRSQNSFRISPGQSGQVEKKERGYTQKTTAVHVPLNGYKQVNPIPSPKLNAKPINSKNKNQQVAPKTMVNKIKNTAQTLKNKGLAAALTVRNKAVQLIGTNRLEKSKQILKSFLPKRSSPFTTESTARPARRTRRNRRRNSRRNRKY